MRQREEGQRETDSHADSVLSVEPDAGRARSCDPEIRTLAETKNWMLNCAAPPPAALLHFFCSLFSYGFVSASC